MAELIYNTMNISTVKLSKRYTEESELERLKEAVVQLTNEYLPDYQVYWVKLNDSSKSHDNPVTDEDYKDFWQWLKEITGANDSILIDLRDKEDGASFGIYDMIHIVRKHGKILVNP